MRRIVGHTMVPLDKNGIYVEWNMANISPTIEIKIPRTHVKVENVYICAVCSPEEIHIYTDLFKEFQNMFSWSYEEIPGIDPSIVEQKIKTYLNVKPVRQ